MGMSYELYWDGEPGAVRFYREADRIRQERANESAWLQGAYIYDAIGKLAPILNGFVKKPKAEPYPKQPYDIFPERKKESEEDQARRQMEKNMEMFRVRMSEINSRIKQQQKGGTANG